MHGIINSCPKIKAGLLMQCFPDNSYYNSIYSSYLQESHVVMLVSQLSTLPGEHQFSVFNDAHKVHAKVNEHQLSNALLESPWWSEWS